MGELGRGTVGMDEPRRVPGCEPLAGRQFGESTPAPVALIDDAVQVSAGEFLTSGEVWCWGRNEYGALGVPGTPGEREAHPFPVYVAGVADAVEVRARRASVCARTRGGEVWCWGANFVGDLGDGTRASTFVPVRAVGLSDAVALADTCAIRRGRGYLLSDAHDARHAPLGMVPRAGQPAGVGASDQAWQRSHP
jgi:hypothetical protein